MSLKLFKFLRKFQLTCRSKTFKGNIAYLNHADTKFNFRLQPEQSLHPQPVYSCVSLKTVATFVPDVCLKNLHSRVLVKRHIIYNQLDGSLELCHIAKHLWKNTTLYISSILYQYVCICITNKWFPGILLYFYSGNNFCKDAHKTSRYTFIKESSALNKCMKSILVP